MAIQGLLLSSLYPTSESSLRPRPVAYSSSRSVSGALTQPEDKKQASEKMRAPESETLSLAAKRNGHRAIIMDLYQHVFLELSRLDPESGGAKELHEALDQ
ncbi:MAG: hypothetical protein DDT26_02557 [Dehalococcoidia bacterium]|nr:hypothetical protein [Chloroflexota bacterium]